jgi:DNA polymerase-1
VPFQLWGGGAMELLDNYEGEFVYHNASFDLKFLILQAGYRPPWHRIHDTLTLAALIDPLRPKGLKPLASRLVDPKATAGEKLLHDGMSAQGWTWANVPLNFAPYWVYAALDPVLTAHIWSRTHPVVMADAPEVYDLERAVLRICTAMMLKGMRLDVPYIHEAKAKFAGFSREVRAWLKARYGVNLGEKIYEYTDAGAPKMDKDNLTAYMNGGKTEEVRKLAAYLLEVRHADKMAGTYLDNFIEMMDADEVLHCSINPLAARTSRMSVSEPSLQNLPRDDKAVRGSFIPRDGMALISCDADQIEMRMASHLSDDSGLIQAFLDADQPGAPDFFSTVASELYRADVRKGDPRRQLTKNYGYAKLYGSGLRTMARTAGVPYERVRELDEAWVAKYPGLDHLMKKVVYEAVQMRNAGGRPAVRTMMGRYLPGEARREYALLNYLIQGSAAEALKRGMVDLDAAGLLDCMLLPIHDEVLLEAPVGQVHDVLALVEETLTDRTTYRVPITWSGDVMEERWKKV